MKETKHPLTNELLRKHFKNNFNLVKIAINFALEKMKKGEDFNIQKILKELLENLSQEDSENIAPPEDEKKE